uniref:Uncharacterized protein n=1 Tax=Globisporangium ultimum (strain ATCC 200006 / CBS 805.95 / DAOM BR144) TaxID=431595 RepID=K3W531_GLOUD
MFFTFLRSRGGSFSSFTKSDDADGIIDTVATRLTIVNLMVTLRPFQSLVALQISSPTFFGERPRGPTFGARAEAGATSPPTVLKMTIFSSPAGGGGAMRMR